MKVVMIALQRTSANGICAHAIAKELARRGHSVVWVCNEEMEPPSAEQGISYEFVRPRIADAALSRWSGGGDPRRIATVFLNRVKMAATFRSWPLISKRYSRRVTRAALAASQGADVVVGVYTQIDALVAAHAVKSKMPGVRYIAYFLDSFGGGHCPRFLSQEGVRKRAQEWCCRLLGNADGVVAMESSRRFHERYTTGEPYYRMITYLDLPLLDLNRSAGISGVGGQGVKTIVYAGTLPAEIRSPKYFLDILQIGNLGDIHVVFIGDESNRNLNEAAAHDERIEVLGRMEHERVASYLRDADYLLTLGNAISSMTPSKIFEYMSYQKPIIATYPIEDEPSLPYLTRYGDALLLDERADPEEGARRLREYLSRPHEQIPRDELREKFWSNTPSAFCDLVERIGEQSEI